MVSGGTGIGGGRHPGCVRAESHPGECALVRVAGRLGVIKYLKVRDEITGAHQCVGVVLAEDVAAPAEASRWMAGRSATLPVSKIGPCVRYRPLRVVRACPIFDGKPVLAHSRGAHSESAPAGRGHRVEGEARRASSLLLDTRPYAGFAAQLFIEGARCGALRYLPPLALSQRTLRMKVGRIE